MIPVYEPEILPQYTQAVTTQMESGWVGPGKKTTEFEEAFAEYIGVKYAVATNSGSSALLLSLLSLHIPEGTQIHIPAYGYVAAANTAKTLGYSLNPIDINPGNLCMDIAKLEEALEEHRYLNQVVIFINHNGYSGWHLLEIRELCNKYEVDLIEDAATALGVVGAGTTGELATFSFSVPKLITTGQGGMVVTNNHSLAKRVREWQDQGGGWRADRTHKKLGLNLRMPDINGALGLAQLNNIYSICEKRKTIWDWYRTKTTLNMYDIYGDSGWCILARFRKSDEIIEQLHNNNIGASRFYKAIYDNHHFKDLADKKCPEAEKAARELVYLPSSLTLTEQQVIHIGQVINDT